MHFLGFSILDLHRNDKFADVLLFTSQSDGGSGIPAHKIILSSCSHVSIFDIHHCFDENSNPENWVFICFRIVFRTNIRIKSGTSKFNGVHCITARIEQTIDTDINTVYVQR